MKLSELPPEIQKKAYEKWFSNFYWSDEYIIDQAKEDGKARGFNIDRIYYSGFWSQGDGASWSGTIDIPKFMEYYKEREDNPLTPQEMLLFYAAFGDDLADSFVSVHVSGHYSHSGGMKIHNGILIYSPVNAEITVGIYAGMSADVFYEMLTEAADEVEKKLLKAARDYAGDIYKQLEQEYEHQTSEENFREQCEINEYEFDEEGEML